MNVFNLSILEADTGWSMSLTEACSTVGCSTARLDSTPCLKKKNTKEVIYYKYM